MKVTIAPRTSVRGSIDAPGDKSLSHRALLFAALANGRSSLTHLGPGADVASTAAALEAMGVKLTLTPGPDGPSAEVIGRGPQAIRSPSAPIDCGNSGTSMRLLAGLIAGLGLDVTLVGDDALSRRPMRRVLAPLRAMGANAHGRVLNNNEVAPLEFKAGAPLRGQAHDLPIASAQVKSCLALAGLFADGLTSVREPGHSRDHTERMLQALGAPLRVVDGAVEVERLTGALEPLGHARIPGDPSSAAFFVIAALLARSGSLTIRGVNLNPTRIGFLHVVERMGAAIERAAPSSWLGEPQADLVITAGRPLRATTIGPDEVPSLVDEIPILATLATQAEGRTEIRGAGELRVKESDRLATTAAGLNALGAQVTELDDGLIIEGPTPLEGGQVDSHEDHRIAMSMAVAALACRQPVVIEGAEWVDTSFPGFFALLDAVAPVADPEPAQARAAGDLGREPPRADRSAADARGHKASESRTAAPLRLAVIGAPVHHSLSPLLWEQLLALSGQAGKMEAVEVPPEALASFLDEVRQGRFDALSVTLPHKERLLDLVDEAEPAARRMGAANFIARRPDGRLVAANTDVDGVHLALVHAPLLGRRAAAHAQRVVILGAGGAARAAAVALLDEGCQSVVVANRTEERAQRLVESLGDPRLSAAALRAADLEQAVAHADLIINATSVGLTAPDDDPLPTELTLSSRHNVMDMVYRPRATALLRRAAAHCAAPIDGLWMLAGQALAAFERLTQRNAHHLLEPLHDHLSRALDREQPAHLDLDFLAARAAIDRVDGEMVRLLGERFAAAGVIGRVKARLDEPVVRPAREQSLRQRLRERGAAEGLPDGFVDRVYDPVLDASRAVQEALRQRPAPTTLADEPPLMAPPPDDEEPS